MTMYTKEQADPEQDKRMADFEVTFTHAWNGGCEPNLISAAAAVAIMKGMSGDERVRAYCLVTKDTGVSDRERAVFAYELLGDLVLEVFGTEASGQPSTEGG